MFNLNKIYPNADDIAKAMPESSPLRVLRTIENLCVVGYVDVDPMGSWGYVVTQTGREEVGKTDSHARKYQ